MSDIVRHLKPPQCGYIWTPTNCWVSIAYLDDILMLEKPIGTV